MFAHRFRGLDPLTGRPHVQKSALWDREPDPMAVDATLRRPSVFRPMIAADSRACAELL